MIVDRPQKDWPRGGLGHGSLALPFILGKIWENDEVALVLAIVSEMERFIMEPTPDENDCRCRAACEVPYSRTQMIGQR